MDSEKLFECLESLPLDHQKCLSQWGRGPNIPVPHQTAHAAFEAIVDSHPYIIAAKFGENTITYQELDVRANKLANHLIELGLKPKERVCMVVQRSIEMLVGIFAILKAGCQYVPIDGGVASKEALHHILHDTEAPFVLCLEKFQDRVKDHWKEGTTLVVLGKRTDALCSEKRPQIKVSSKDGIYAIYTSGSTGTPKGVDVAHGNVTNALLLQPGSLGITVGSKVAQVLNIAFDMGAWEILACLMNGGTLHIRGSRWEETLSEVDTLISTPSILAKYRRAAFPNIKTVVTGGEPCPQALADEWADNVRFYNICGPTEITILNTAHRHTPNTPLTIGKPLPNTTLYILNDEENPVRVGEKGVMWVGGRGVTRGYINLPELTARRYKRDKYANDGSIMFNTGDIVKWREDGSLETFGRMDDQVKIKGFRVELDGVVSVIEKFPGVTRAHATLLNGALHGFYTAATCIDELALIEFVRLHLPYYSVPELWHYLPAIPLTPNGKVNRGELAKLALRPIETMSPLQLSPATSTPSSGSMTLPASPEMALVKSPAESPTTQQSEKTSIYDEEKAITAIKPVVYTSQRSDDLNIASTSTIDLPPALPEKNGFRGQRWLRHRLLILYRRFFTIVFLANFGVACFTVWRRVEEQRPILVDISVAFAANLTMAVLMRSEPVINLLFTTFCSVPTSWPLWIRRHCARIFHIGGIHSSCAIAAVMWFTIFAVGISVDYAKGPALRCISLATLVLTYMVLVIFIAILSTSHPKFRLKYHDIWEYTHRFGGWTALAILWAHAFLSTRDLRWSGTALDAYKTSPPIYLLAVATAAIAFPWVLTRRVPVRSEVLSSHAIRLHFTHTHPVVGTSVRISQHPLKDWHGFATITNKSSAGKGFSLVVSNAGDFTKGTIQRAPTHMYTRGIPACGVLRIATLFKSIVLVATGSGIGPCLAVIIAKQIPCRILWSTPHPEQTFGQEIMDDVLSCDPKALIWNTRTQGKPNMPLLAWQLYKESGAEAVCVISNKRFTNSIVYAMETRGIPAYGAIFDS